MIKLIVSDIDGTLVEDGGNALNPEYFETILKLKEQGIYFAAASGRHAASIEYLFAPIRERIFFIGDNGAYTGCYGRELFVHEYPRELAFSVINDMKAMGLDIMVDCAERVYTDSKNQEFINWLTDGYHFRMTRMEDVRDLKETVIKISACRMEDVTGAYPFFQEKYGDRLKVTLAGKQWIDTMDPAVNKGNAVRVIQESLDIAPEETLAFGDQLNDIEMLKQAYYSFAVANARPETKKAARFLADSNGGLGPLKIMKLFLNENQERGI